MFTDENRSRVHDAIRRRQHQLFAHLLSPDLFLQAAALCGLQVVACPLNLVNLVWLALSAALRPDSSFADLLDAPLKALRDDEHFAGSPLDRHIDDANRQRPPPPAPGAGRHAHRGGCREHARHDPRQGRAEAVSPAAFAAARQRMPPEFWVALLVLLGQRFRDAHGDALRWGRFRLLAVDGTRLDLPDWPALRAHFGTARNGQGSHNAQARLVLLQCPLARLPVADALAPVKIGETTLARQLLRGLQGDDLVLLDAGYRSYGVLAQIDAQDASFCLRLGQKLNLKVLRQLGSADDVLVRWQPKDSRGQWRQEGLPKALRLRLLTYRSPGFRPLRLLTNVLCERDVSYAQWWGLSVSEQGEVLSRGLYNCRWEVETTFRELKVDQQLEGRLRSRTAEGVAYEVAGHLLCYLLLRWLLVEAAQTAGRSPLRLSFAAALAEVKELAGQALVSSAAWVEQTLRPRLRQRLAEHVVAERPGRSYPRAAKQRRAQKRARTAAYRRAQKAKARAARQAKGGGRPKPKVREWFGQGWDLRGRRADPCPTEQG